MDYHFIVVFLQCCGLFSVISASTIILGPQDTDAFVGGNVTFYCTVENLGNSTVIWRNFDSGDVYSKNRTIVIKDGTIQPARFTVTGDDAEGTFNLEITGITKSLDNKKYQCFVMFLGGNTEYIEEAELQVYSIPPSPTCSVPRINNVFVEWENVNFKCTFESVIPKVEINLTRNGDMLSSLIVNPDLNERHSTSSVSFIATSDENRASLRCSVVHPLLSIPYECSITLNVTHRPIVIIQKEVESELTLFKFHAKSNPNAIKYEWTLYLGYTVNDTIYLGNETYLAFKWRNQVPDKPVARFKDYHLHDQASEKPELSVLSSSIDNMTIPEKKTLIQCSLKCSVINSIGEGRDDHNTTCTIENGTIIFGKQDVSNNMNYYIIIGAICGGTALILIIILIIYKIIVTLKNKTASVNGNVTDTVTDNRTQFSNNGYNGSVGNQKDNIYSENPVTRDKKEGNIPSNNLPKSMPEKDDAGDAHNSDTFQVNGEFRRKPEGDVAMNAGDGDAVVPMGATPLYAVVNKSLKSSGSVDPAPDVLQSKNGVQ